MEKKSSDPEVVEAEATPIEPPALLSDADRWLAQKREEVAGLAEQYVPHEITSGEDYRQSKRDRASANKAIKAITGERTKKLSALKKAINDFEFEVRELLDPLNGVDKAYKAEIEAWERMVIESRTQEVEAWYAETQGDVAQMVPFKAIWDRYSADGKWGSYGANVEQIKSDVYERVGAIEGDWATIDASPYDADEKAAIKASYCKSLDVGAAMREAQEARERRERIAQVEAERKRRAEEAERAMREAQEAEEARARAERQAQARQEVPQPAPQPEPQPAPGPQLVQFVANVEQPKLDGLLAYCKSHDIHGSIRYL